MFASLSCGRDADKCQHMASTPICDYAERVCWPLLGNPRNDMDMARSTAGIVQVEQSSLSLFLRGCGTGYHVEFTQGDGTHPARLTEVHPRASLQHIRRSAFEIEQPPGFALFMACFATRRALVGSRVVGHVCSNFSAIRFRKCRRKSSGILSIHVRKRLSNSRSRISAATSPLTIIASNGSRPAAISSSTALIASPFAWACEGPLKRILPVVLMRQSFRPAPITTREQKLDGSLNNYTPSVNRHLPVSYHSFPRCVFFFLLGHFVCAFLRATNETRRVYTNNGTLPTA